MIHAGLELARRLEIAEGINGVACAEAQQRIRPESGAAVMEAAGGWAIFVGVESSLTQGLALGMRGPVSAADVERMEEFFLSRGAAPAVDLCPLADVSLIELLGKRGYRVVEFNNVLVRPLAAVEIEPPEIVREAYADEEHLWARSVGQGFLEKDELTPEEVDVGSAIWHMPDSRCYLAFGGGRAAAAGALTVNQGLAILFADSTMLGFRGAGLHAALIRERLRVAAAAGCDLATASALPGSVSQRNYERNGFQPAYTKAILTRAVT